MHKKFFNRHFNFQKKSIKETEFTPPCGTDDCLYRFEVERF
jgi:hypothetical protein